MVLVLLAGDTSMSSTSQTEILNNNLSELQVFVKANTGYTCHMMPMPKPLCQQYILTLQETTFVFLF